MAWGPDHTLWHSQQVDTINNLSLVYADQGKLDQAENMYVASTTRIREDMTQAEVEVTDMTRMKRRNLDLW